jgi:Ca2+-binding RTX toxin-like protein
MGTALLLSSGVALALNVINCESEEPCRGTDRDDLMKGTDGFNYMLGRGDDDTLKGFGRSDGLLGQEGDDRLLGGLGFDYLAGGRGDDRLRGEGRVDEYGFERFNWGQDTIIEESPSRNAISLPYTDSSAGTITTNLNSTLAAEVTNPSGTSTVNWDGNVIAFVFGSSGNDEVTGNDAANTIIDDAESDTDTILAGGGNDFIVVQDGDSNDTVDCGEGSDTVYFDTDDTLVSPDDCEEKNPEDPGLAAREATADGAGIVQGAPPIFSGDHRPQ